MAVWARLWAVVGLAAAATAGTGCAPVAVGGAVGGAAVAASEERGFSGFVSDAEIQAKINHLWFRHSVDLLHRLDMTVDHGRVLLTGQATDAQMRLDAVRLAWQVDGVKEVINEIQVGSGAGILDGARDTWISTQLRGVLTFDKTIHSQNYSIDTVNGVVYLMGVAADQAELDRVIQHARSQPYVQRVVSHVQVARAQP
ncbi:BON domain-containing protein [Azospirillum sp. A39]|uniref:BON domain-containing protein n=1 Tax=Azospirillum sp. A39 TaxID=3462279 RepID=UPI0040455621